MAPAPERLRAVRISESSLTAPLAHAQVQAQRLSADLSRAINAQHFSKTSKTNLLKSYEQVQVLPTCPHALMALYLVLMVSAHERKLQERAAAQNTAQNAAPDVTQKAPSRKVRGGDALSRAQVDPQQLAAIMDQLPETSFAWLFATGRLHELKHAGATALLYYRAARAYDAPLPSLADELEQSITQLTQVLSAPATVDLAARAALLQERVADFTRRLGRYPEGRAVPLVELHQNLLTELLKWYLPQLTIEPAPFPVKNWGIKGALDPSIKGPVPQGFWLNERGSIELSVPTATMLELQQLEGLVAHSLRNAHALFELHAPSHDAPLLDLAGLDAPRCDCYRVSNRWSHACALIEFTSSGLTTEPSPQIAALIPPYQELRAAAGLGLQLTVVRLNAHDFALPREAPRHDHDGAKVNTAAYGSTPFYRFLDALVTALAQHAPCAQLMGYRMGLQWHYLDFLVNDSAAFSAELTRLRAHPPLKAKLSALLSYSLLTPPQPEPQPPQIEPLSPQPEPEPLTPELSPNVTKPAAKAGLVAQPKKRLSLRRSAPRGSTQNTPGGAAQGAGSAPGADA